jgi:hypothetical protein
MSVYSTIEKWIQRNLWIKDFVGCSLEVRMYYESERLGCQSISFSQRLVQFVLYSESLISEFKHQMWFLPHWKSHRKWSPQTVASELITYYLTGYYNEITQLPVVSCIHRTACGIMCPVFESPVSSIQRNLWIKDFVGCSLEVRMYYESERLGCQSISFSQRLVQFVLYSESLISEFKHQMWFLPHWKSHRKWSPQTVASELITYYLTGYYNEITQLPVVSCIHRTACGIMCPVFESPVSSIQRNLWIKNRLGWCISSV